jgi:hypothetical protein
MTPAQHFIEGMKVVAILGAIGCFGLGALAVWIF